MNYKIFLIFISFLFFLGCKQSINSTKKINNTLENRYKNSGFALVYNKKLLKIKEIEPRSLDIYHKSLKKKSTVKITNPKNGKYLLANVKSNKIKYSNFYNSVLSLRIAEELELDLNEPYIEIILLAKDSMFVAKKAKMFEEEKRVAEKAPVDGIKINDLNVKKSKKINVKKKNFSYIIKIADFYYKKSAQTMLDKIKKENLIDNLSIVKLSDTKYRVLIGPFNDINSLKNSFEKMSLFNFENLEVLNNV
tara:strand:+ start:4789 stop:5538 length:750 start_codon:yes stop_codon:yes gene_type:complete